VSARQATLPFMFMFLKAFVSRFNIVEIPLA
jgi:hypothetical protein